MTVVAPPLVVTKTLGLSLRAADFLMSVSLFTSNVSAFVRYEQVKNVNANLLYVRKADFSFVNPVVSTNVLNKLPLVFNAYVITSSMRVIVDHVLGCAHGVVAPLMSNVMIALVKVDLVGMNVATYNKNISTRDGNAFKDFRGLNLTLLMLVLVVLFGEDSGHCLHVDSVIVNLVVKCLIT